jgi:predicted transcriptional regulator
MIRQEEVDQFEELVEDASCGHVHIRKKAIVAGFVENLENYERNDIDMISINISDWNYEEMMTTLRWELQKDLSMIDYMLSRISSVGATLFGFGGSGEVEEAPDYSRVRKYLRQVSEQAEDNLIIFVHYHGQKPVDGFGWISKLSTLPDNTTLVTHGYQRCEREDTAEIEVGRLTEDQSIRYISESLPGIKQEVAEKAHRVHDGNPVAIDIALDQNQLETKLSGEELEKLWSEVYDNKLSAEEWDLLLGSAHLVDLDYRDVAMTVEKTAGECRELLQNLESKGIVSRKKSGLYTTDRYVKRYVSNQLQNSRIEENHRISFHNYAERWVDRYVSQTEQMRAEGEKMDMESAFFSEDADYGYTDPNLYLAAHHLSNISEKLSIDEFVEELNSIEGKKSGIFVFGMYTQRFFFEDPNEVIGELSDSVFEIEGDISGEAITGTMSIILDLSFKQYLETLSEGWNGNINTESLETTNVSDPSELVSQIQGLNYELYEGLPSDVKLAIARLIVIPYVDM